MVVGIVREVILPQPSKEGNSFIFAGNGILVRDGQWSHISSSTVFGSSSVLSDLQSLTSNFFYKSIYFYTCNVCIPRKGIIFNCCHFICICNRFPRFLFCYFYFFRNVQFTGIRTAHNNSFLSDIFAARINIFQSIIKFYSISIGDYSNCC